MSNLNQSEQRFQTLPNVMQKNADTFWKAQADILDVNAGFHRGLVSAAAYRSASSSRGLRAYVPS